MPNLEELLSIMARLRDPEGGCPWDLAQNFASISPHTIEEAYEVDEAIASGDLESLRDELGDLLFQVVFQARIAEEMGAFDFGGVVDAIVDKLVRRHPHIFADADTPETVEGQLQNWEAIKAAERAAAGRDQEGGPDPFAGIPRSLPALARSTKIANRLAREGVGPSDDSATARLEEMDRCTKAMRARLVGGSSEASGSEGAGSLERAVGEGLRSWALLAQTLRIDPEQALREVDDALIDQTRGATQSKPRH